MKLKPVRLTLLNVRSTSLNSIIIFIILYFSLTGRQNASEGNLKNEEFNNSKPMVSYAA